MDRMKFVQLKSIKAVNRLLVALLAALIIFATHGNVGFLWMQAYYYVTHVKDKLITTTQTYNAITGIGLVGDELGDYTYFVSGMVDPDFNCGLCGDKAADATIIWNTCIEAGVSPEATAGIINNYFGEAHVWQYNGAYAGDASAVAWCKAQVTTFNNGNMTPEVFSATKYVGGSSTAFGAWQWLGNRKLNLAKSARNAGMDIGSVEFQINYVLCEIGVKNNLTDFDVRFGESYWEDFVGTAAMTPKEYAEYFACYFEGYNGTTNLADYQVDTQSNRNHTASAQEIYDKFMEAAEEYAELHSQESGASYAGDILPAGFASQYNIDTTKMTEKRWKIVEKAYYWCEYGSGDYIRYLYGASRNQTWEDFDSLVEKKSVGYVDCSLFVRELYKYAGIDGLPDATGSGYTDYGFYQISPDNLVAGDIVARNGHVLIFLGWIDPDDHSKGYYKADASSGKVAAKSQVLISKRYREIVLSKGWDGNDRAYRHNSLPIGNGVASASSGASRVDVGGGGSKGVLLIGDSRTEGMCNAVGMKLSEFGSFKVGSYHAKKGEDGNLTVICCVSAGYSLLEDSSVQAEVKSAVKSGKTIAIALGVNDRAFDKYYKWIKNVGTDVYWFTVGPVKNQAILQSAINSFNSNVRSSSLRGGYKIFDYEKEVKSRGDGVGNTSDGLHYSSTINKELYKAFYKAVCE